MDRIEELKKIPMLDTQHTSRYDRLFSSGLMTPISKLLLCSHISSLVNSET
jgi:hypothetical protein